MKLVRISYALLGLVFLITFFGVLVLQYPFVSRLPLQQQGITVTDTDHANLAEGDIYLRPTHLPGIPLIRAKWRWCPGYRLLSWCVDIESTDVDISGRLSLGLQTNHLQNAVIELNSLRPAGIQPGLADIRAKLFIKNMEFSDLTCPLRSVETLDASMRAKRFSLLGMDMGRVSLSAVSHDRGLHAKLSGDHISGSLDSLNNRSFSGNLLLNPPAGDQALLQRFAQRTQDGSYEWKISGDWPCFAS